MDLRGQRIYNRYLLGALLGEGADAVVYCAMDGHLGRVVAIKLLRPELCADPTLVTRFEREARGASRLNHPNIVPIYDYGKALDTYFFVMEYVRGGHLGSRLRAGQPLAPDAALWLAAQVADALGAAHERGVVHRDVKPANILLTEEGCPKLTDFGIAKLLDIPAVTQASVLLGTPHYLAPEQASGGAITPATDVYALGVVLYEMLAGHRPFVGNGLQVAMQHVHAAPPPLTDVNPGVSPAVAAVVARALAKEPAQRYADGAALGAALRAEARALHRRMRGTFALRWSADPSEERATARTLEGGVPDRASGAVLRPTVELKEVVVDRVSVAAPPAPRGRRAPAAQGLAVERGAVRAGAASVGLTAAARRLGPSSSLAVRPSRRSASAARTVAALPPAVPRTYAVRHRRGGSGRRAALLAAGFGLVLSGLVGGGVLRGDTDSSPIAASAPPLEAAEPVGQSVVIAASPAIASQGMKPIVTLDDTPAPVAAPPPALAERASSAVQADGVVVVSARPSAPAAAEPVSAAPSGQASATTLRVTSASDRGPARRDIAPEAPRLAPAAPVEPDDIDAGEADTPHPSPAAVVAPPVAPTAAVPEPARPKPRAPSPGQWGRGEPPALPPLVWGPPPPVILPPMLGLPGPMPPVLAPVPSGLNSPQRAPGAANRGSPHR